MADHLTTARTVAGHTGPVITAPEKWLLTRSVHNWSGPRSLPLWLGDPDWFGMNSRDCTRSRAKGLIPRPLEQTLADTLAWNLARLDAGPHGAGLTDDEKRDVLDAHASMDDKPIN